MKKKSNLFIVVIALLSLTFLDSCDKGKDTPIKLAWTAGCSGNYIDLDESKAITKICFGSCGAQILPQPLLATAADQNPDLYIFMGDNIYGDTDDMEYLQGEYLLLCEKDEFAKLKSTASIMATWDDHDFGINDAGSENPTKVESKQVFMEFWGETNNTERMSHLGIYDSKIIGEAGKKVQVILLDTRTFRTEIIFEPGSPFSYLENYDPNASILGAEQWTWLEQQLLKPADVRIIGTSIQLCSEYNVSEGWALFPLEQEKMFNLIASTQASGAFFLSGDVHYSELTKREPSNTYPIYDFTSSGITGTTSPDDNMYRVDGPFVENNIGMIDIDWNGADTKIKWSILNEAETVLIEREINLSEIQF